MSSELERGRENSGPNRRQITRKQDGVLINSVFDYIMDNVRGNMGTLGQYRAVPIPDLVERVEATSVSSSVAGTLKASQGTLRDLTSLRRVGDLTLSTEAGVLHVTGSIGLRTLKAIFRKYSLQAAVFKKSGDMLSVEVGKNVFDVHLTIRFDGLNCYPKLERITSIVFGDVSVDITGFSMLNPIGCKVAEWFIQFFQGFIRDIVENYAKDMVNNVVKDKALISRLMGYGMEGMVVACQSKCECKGEDSEQVSGKCKHSRVTIVVEPCSCCGHKVNVI